MRTAIDTAADITHPNQRLAISAAGTAFLWALAAVTDSEQTAAFTAAVGCFCLTWVGASYVRQPASILGMLSLGAFFLFITINVGFLLAWTVQHYVLEDQLVEVVRYFGIEIGDYARAAVYATLFLIAMNRLASLKRLRHAESKLVRAVNRCKLVPCRQLQVVLIAITISEMVLVLSGIVGHRSLQVEGAEEGVLAWFVPFLEAAETFQVPLNALYFFKLNEQKARLNHWAVLIVLLSFLMSAFMAFNVGRRPMLLCFLLHFIYYSFFAGRLPQGRNLAMLGLAAFIVIPTMLEFNDFLRSGSRGVSDFKQEDALSVISSAWEGFSSEEGREAESERTAGNLSSRPLFLTPLAIVISIPTDEKDFMWGKDLLSGLAWTVPRVIFPEKVDVNSLEELAYEHFHDRIFQRDTANSVYLSSYMDFGWFGLISHPCILAFIWIVVLKLTEWSRSTMAQLLIFATWPPMFMMGIGEAGMTTWFTDLRGSVMLFLIMRAVDLMKSTGTAGVRGTGFLGQEAR